MLICILQCVYIYSTSLIAPILDPWFSLWTIVSSINQRNDHNSVGSADVALIINKSKRMLTNVCIMYFISELYFIRDINPFHIALQCFI